MRPLIRISVVVGIALYLLLLIAEAATKSPYMDEFFVARPAYNLAFHGFPGTTGVEMTNSGWSGIDRRTFNTLPMGILVDSVFYKVAGFSLIGTRLVSMFFGVAVLAATWETVKRLTGDLRRSWLTVIALALNYSFALAAGFGRVDMLTAACGIGAQAVYLTLRLSHFRLAIFCGSALLTISGLTHPNGILYFLCWVVLILWFDRTKLKLPDLLAASLPFLIGGVGWLAYVLQSPQDAINQLSTNASQHDILNGLKHPIHAIAFEFEDRYLHSVFAWNPGPKPPLAVRLKGVVTASYLVSVFGILAVPALRRKTANQIMLIQVALIFFYLCFFDALKFPWYLLLSVPLYCALLADLSLYFWDRRTVPRWSLALLSLGLVTIHLGGIAYKILQNPYRNDYLPAVHFLQQQTTPARLVFAKCDFSFGYGFERNMLDDSTWGYFSRKVPDFVVWDANVAWDLNAWYHTNRQIYNHMQDMMSSYKLVYQHGTYRIYKRP